MSGLKDKIIYRCNKDIQVTEYLFRSPKLSEDAAGFRIAQVSDLQSEWFGKWQKDLLDAVRGQDPDIIVITGDILDRGHTDLEAARCAAAGLCGIAPVFYVNGNHEADIKSETVGPFYNWIREVGVNVLFDETRSIEAAHGAGAACRVNIMGLSEETVFKARGQETGTGRKVPPKKINEKIVTDAVDGLVNGVPAGGLNILLAHEPQLFDLYARPCVDLIFSGHAHGGQFRLPGGIGLFSPNQGIFPSLTQGMHKKNGAAMVISRGLGNSSFGLRLNNRPEIVTVSVLPEGKRKDRT